MAKNQARDSGRQASAAQAENKAVGSENEGQGAASNEPAAPASLAAELQREPDPEDVQPPQPAMGEFLEIMSTSERGFWRCGRHFTKKPKRFLLDSFSSEELERLQVEHDRKMIIVKLIEAPL